MNYTEAFFDELDKIAVDWSIAIPAAAGAGLGGVGGYYGAKRLGAGKGGRIAGGVLGGVAGGALGAGGSLALQPEKAKALLSKFRGGDEAPALRGSTGSGRAFNVKPQVKTTPKVAPSTSATEIVGPTKPAGAPPIRWKPSGSKAWRVPKAGPKSAPKPKVSPEPSMKWKPSGTTEWKVPGGTATVTKTHVDNPSEITKEMVEAANKRNLYWRKKLEI